MTPAERSIYDRLCKVQGSMFKLIGNIESKIGMVSDAGKGTEAGK